jgi:large subunit ribosomal protein L15
MKLNEIKDNKGARQTPKLLGRGIGSGKGKTGGRGVKGQKARSGVAVKGFEGGQSPLLRRMPKRGFNNYENAGCYAEVTLDMVQAAIDAKRLKPEGTVDAKALIAAKVIRHAHEGVRLLGTGTLKAKVSFNVTHATKGATAAVEKLGGKVEILPAKINKLLKPKKVAK